jgi:hypothetical protein
MTTPSGPQLSASSSVGLGEYNVALHARVVPVGTKCRVNCNGQKVTLTFDGDNIEVDVHSPTEAAQLGDMPEP